MGQNPTLQSLRKNILSGIQVYEYRRAKRFLALSAVAGAVSLIGLVGSIWYLATSLYQTSFYYYSTLVFTDTDLVLSYWREFFLSLAETLPVFGVTLVLAGLVAFLLSVRAIVDYRERRGPRPSFGV